MKKSITFLFIAILFFCCSENGTIEKTEIGLFTPYSYFPEKVNGKVKEIKETNYWPIVSNGETEAGERLSAAARDTLNWTSDFIAIFDESGLVEKVNHINENDEQFESWIIKNEAGYPVKASFFIKDSIAVIDEITKLNEFSYRWNIINPETDTLRSTAVMKLDENRNIKTLQWYNLTGEPTYKYEWTYDSSGLMSGYTASRNDTVRGGMNFTPNEMGFWKTQEVYNNITGNSDKTNYKYEYDKTGNWIKAVSFVDEKQYIVVLREYIYY